MNNTYEILFNDKEVQSVLKNASGKYKNVLDEDELINCRTDALWKCIKKYDPKKGNTFKNSLYRFVIWQCKNAKRIKLNKIKCINTNCDLFCDKKTVNYDLIDEINSLPDDFRKVIFQKFYENRNNKEISVLNGWSINKTKKIIETALQHFRRSYEDLGYI